MWPKKGQKFTISANKRCKDRSYCSEVLLCVDANKISVLAKAKKFRGGTQEIVLLKSEHDFDLMPPEPEELEEPNTPRFYKNQPVRGVDGHSIISGLYSSTLCGRHTLKVSENYFYTLDHIEPDLLAPTLANWIEVEEGSRGSIKYSKDEMCIAIYEDGEQFLVDPESCGLYLHSVVRYCVIPLPKFGD